MNAEQFRDFIQIHCQATAAQVADYLGVTPTTVRRWLSGAVKVPRCAILALQALSNDLGDMHPGFSGFALDRIAGHLITSYGDKYTPGQLNAYTITPRQVETLRIQIKEQQKEIEYLNTRIARLADPAIVKLDMDILDKADELKALIDKVTAAQGKTGHQEKPAARENEGTQAAGYRPELSRRD